MSARFAVLFLGLCCLQGIDAHLTVRSQYPAKREWTRRGLVLCVTKEDCWDAGLTDAQYYLPQGGGCCVVSSITAVALRSKIWQGDTVSLAW